MKEIFIDILKVIVFTIVIAGVAIGIAYIKDTETKENYNNGLCKQCGESITFVNGSSDHFGDTYYYTCPNGHITTLSEVPNETN